MRDLRASVKCQNLRSGVQFSQDVFVNARRFDPNGQTLDVIILREIMWNEGDSEEGGGSDSTNVD